MTISAGQAILKADLDSSFHVVDGYGDVAAARKFTVQRNLFVDAPAAAPAGELTLLFTPNDNEEFRALILDASVALGASEDLKVTLSVFGSSVAENAVALFLLDETPEVTLTTGQTRNSRLDDSDDDDRLFLLAGVTYRLQLEVVQGTPLQVTAILKTRTRPRRA